MSCFKGLIEIESASRKVLKKEYESRTEFERDANCIKVVIDKEKDFAIIDGVFYGNLFLFACEIRINSWVK